MRIGIDGGSLANRRGFGRFARRIIDALDELKARGETPHDFVLILDEPSRDLVPVPSHFEVVSAPVSQAPSEAASAQGRRSVADLLTMSRAAASARLDALFFPASYSFFPVWNVGAVVVMIHDTLALDFPEKIFLNARRKWCYTCKERLAAAWADRVVTGAESAKRDLIRWFGLPPERIDLIPEGPEPIFRPLDAHDPRVTDRRSLLGRLGIDPSAPFALYVGGLNPHKNLVRLVEAFGAARHDLIARDPSAGFDRLQLVLVGDHRDKFATHIPEIRAAGVWANLGDRLVLPGFVSDDDLVGLYNAALMYCHPSLMEGFGLPVAEAMACGRAVAASDAGSLPEVTGGAGLLFDPYDVADIARAIVAIVGNPGVRTDLERRALIRARSFHRDETARSLIAILERTARDPILGPRARRTA